jgi:hypothetical protein
MKKLYNNDLCVVLAAPLKTDLSRLICPGCTDPDRLIENLTFPGFPGPGFTAAVVLSVLSLLKCWRPALSFLMSCPGFPVLAVLSWLSYPGCPLPAIPVLNVM